MSSAHVSEVQQELSSGAHAEQTFTYPQPVVPAPVVPLKPARQPEPAAKTYELREEETNKPASTFTPQPVENPLAHRTFTPRQLNSTSVIPNNFDFDSDSSPEFNAADFMEIHPYVPPTPLPSNNTQLPEHLSSAHVSEAQQELSSGAHAEQTFTYPEPVVLQPTSEIPTAPATKSPAPVEKPIVNYFASIPTPQEPVEQTPNAPAGAYSEF